MRRKLIWLAAGAVFLLAAWIMIDPLTPTKPAWPPLRFDYSPARHPEPGDPPFSKAPIAATYEERRRMYMDWASRRPTSNERGGIMMDLVKLEAGAAKTVSTVPFDDALDFMKARQDPADFTVSYLVRLYYLHHGDGALTAAQSAALRQGLLAYKYALDDPGENQTEMWTENHQILSHGSDYLIGQMFPEATFTNDGRTGRQHRDKAHALVLRWLNFHLRTGTAEWDSVPYSVMDLAALLNLVEFARDADVQVRATMMVDQILFDAAVNSFYGQFGTSHGRATTSMIRSAVGDSLMDFQTLVFGCGQFRSVDMATSALVTGHRYAPPPVLEAIGRDMPEECVNFERHSIPLTAEAVARYGFSFSNLDDFEIFWGMGAFTRPEVINLTYDAIEKNHLWYYENLRRLRTVGRVLRPLGLLPLASRLLRPDSNGTLMSEVNKVTFRTPDAMLSTAQDYRPGEPGYQQHIWQATLGPYAVVFSTNPGAYDLGEGPGYWTSDGRLPRNAQYRNVLISLYNINRHVAPFGLETRPYGFTHAFFPKWAFDEVVEMPSPAGGGWIFGRTGDGYVALYSHLPYQWASAGPEAGQEIGAPGLQNVWICQVGRKATDGPFRFFVQRIAQAKLEVNGLDVAYHAPGTGELRFAWQGPLTVNGQALDLHDYPRWANPYAHVDFGADRLHIEFQGRSLDLDILKGERTVR
jgi:SAM-dependent methyltransferase